MNFRYLFEKTVAWMLNNKIIVFLSLLSFCLFVSTLAMAGQRNRLSSELDDLKASINQPEESPEAPIEEEKPEEKPEEEKPEEETDGDGQGNGDDENNNNNDKNTDNENNENGNPETGDGDNGNGNPETGDGDNGDANPETGDGDNGNDNPEAGGGDNGADKDEEKEHEPNGGAVVKSRTRTGLNNVPLADIPIVDDDALNTLIDSKMLKALGYAM